MRILSVFGKSLKRSPDEGESAEFGRNARSDWQILCLVFLCLTFASVIMSVIVYAGVDKGEIFLVDKREPVSQKALDLFVLERTIRLFEEKKARFEELKRIELSTVDPFTPKATPKN